MIDKIRAARDDPEALERLFRSAANAGDRDAFTQELAKICAENPSDRFFSAWAYRLDIRPIAQTPGGTETVDSNPRRWAIAIIVSLCLGLVYAAFVDLKLAGAWYWIGWAPAGALAVLSYLDLVDDRAERHRFYGLAALGAIGLALLTALFFWDAIGDIRILVALHLPFLVWAAVGASVTFGHPEPARQFFGYIVKSVEVLLTACVYLSAGMIFTGLSIGIFSILGIQPPERLLSWVAAWGIGFIPVVALASVYESSTQPISQGAGLGPGRILRVVARLILPLALGVLIVYLGFIPAHFWRPFQEREVLIVYNVTVLAMIALLTYVVPGPDETIRVKTSGALRAGVLGACILTLLLNVYALAAMLSRTVNSGLTPNRQAGLGWNAATLLILAILIWTLLRSKNADWRQSFSLWFGRVISLTVVWSLWVVFGLPFV